MNYQTTHGTLSFFIQLPAFKYESKIYVVCLSHLYGEVYEYAEAKARI